jgi:hypothetical protein
MTWLSLPNLFLNLLPRQMVPLLQIRLTTQNPITFTTSPSFAPILASPTHPAPFASHGHCIQSQIKPYKNSSPLRNIFLAWVLKSSSVPHRILWATNLAWNFLHFGQSTLSVPPENLHSMSKLSNKIVSQSSPTLESRAISSGSWNIFLISDMCGKSAKNNFPVLGFQKKPAVGTALFFWRFKASPVNFSSSSFLFTEIPLPATYPCVLKRLNLPSGSRGDDSV